MKKLFFIFAIGVGVLGFAQKKNSQDWHKKEILEKEIERLLKGRENNK